MPNLTKSCIQIFKVASLSALAGGIWGFLSSLIGGTITSNSNINLKDALTSSEGSAFIVGSVGIIAGIIAVNPKARNCVAKNLFEYKKITLGIFLISNAGLQFVSHYLMSFVAKDENLASFNSIKKELIGSSMLDVAALVVYGIFSNAEAAENQTNDNNRGTELSSSSDRRFRHYRPIAVPQQPSLNAAQQNQRMRNEDKNDHSLNPFSSYQSLPG
jgi:hypothetical protein